MRKHLFSDVNAPTQILSENKYDINVNKYDININNVLVIDSKDRDKSRFPDQNKYSITLNPGYADIASIELISARIPLGYNITNNNLSISWQIGSGAIMTCSIEPGNYTYIVNVLDAIIAAMNLVAGAGTFSGIVLDYSDKIQITGPSAFKLLFAGESFRTSNDFIVDQFGNKAYVGRYNTKYLANSIGSILGFDAKDYASDSGNNVISPWPGTLQNGSYLSLFLNRRINFGNIDSSSSVLNKSFCVFETDLGMIRYTKMITEPIKRYTKYFPDAIPSLDVLDIEFIGSDGRPYNFNGQDHLLIFEIKNLSRKT